MAKMTMKDCNEVAYGGKLYIKWLALAMSLIFGASIGIYIFTKWAIDHQNELAKEAKFPDWIPTANDVSFYLMIVFGVIFVAFSVWQMYNLYNFCRNQNNPE